MMFRWRDVETTEIRTKCDELTKRLSEQTNLVNKGDKNVSGMKTESKPCSYCSRMGPYTTSYYKNVHRCTVCHKPEHLKTTCF